MHSLTVVLLLLCLICAKSINVTKDLKCEIAEPEKDENWDSCLQANDTLKYEGPNHLKSFFLNQCFCDRKCSTYSDCCSDFDNLENIPWMCRPLNYRSNVDSLSIYMHQKCLPDWNDSVIKNLCEYELSYLFREKRNYHHLQDMPVYSLEHERMYRNVFCALCNRDMNLKKWTIKYECNNIHVTQEILENLQFDPKRKLWTSYSSIETNVFCKIVVKELKNFQDIFNVYKSRRCHGISQCAPDWIGTEERTKCRSNTKQQYVLYQEDRSLYKNIHCAVCNYVNVTSLKCDSQLFHPLWEGVFKATADYQIILDFNLAGENCAYEQLYDPLLKICLDLSCGKLYEKKEGQCILKANNSYDSKHLNSSCTKVILNEILFVMLDNETVYVNHTEKYYSVEQYEPVLINGELKQILICAEEVISFNFSVVQAWISEIGLVISICCLIVHLIIYVILPKLHNLPGKILISLSASLLAAQLFFLIGSHCDSMTVTCRAMGIITHFSYLAAFFWMNVMALDIFCTFCRSTPRSHHNKTFLKYSLYGWICPILITGLALIMNFVLPDSIYSPHYGENTCWISKKRALIIFFGLPIAVILVINTILFILTSLSLAKTAKETKIANKFNDRTRFVLYVKIALILGLTWIFGFIATLIRISYMWYPFIILNSIQGAYIFLSFTFKRKTWKHLKEKFQAKRKETPFTPGHMKKCTSASNLSTIQTTISSALSVSVPVLCNQKEIVNAIINGKFQPLK